MVFIQLEKLEVLESHLPIAPSDFVRNVRRENGRFSEPIALLSGPVRDCSGVAGCSGSMECEHE